MSERLDSYLQLGLHQSANDWSDVTAAARHLRTSSKINLHGMKRARLPRPYQTGNGSKLADLQGPLMLDTFPALPFNGEGLSGSGAGDGVSTSSLDTALSEVYDEHFGQAAVETQGDTTDGTDAGTGTTCTMDGAVISTGANRAYLIRGTTSNRYMPRFQTGASGADVTMCRALTAAGAADTALEGQVAYGGRVWIPSRITPDRIHYYADCEGDNQRDLYVGMFFSTLTLAPVAGQRLGIELGGALFTDGTPNHTQQNPSYSAPTSGSEIKIWNSPFWIDSAEYMAKDFRVVVQHTLEPRMADGAPNGVYGYAVVDTDVTLEATLHMGALTLEAARSLVDTLQGETTPDLLLAMGNTPGSAAAVRIPQADCDAVVIPDGGKHAIKLTARGAGTTPAQFAVY